MVTATGTFQTIATIPVPERFTVGVRIVVSARCTDLYVDEGLFAEGRGGWTDVAGVATQLGSSITVYTNTLDWTVQFTQVGGNILVQVRGDSYVDVLWLIRWAVDQIG